MNAGELPVRLFVALSVPAEVKSRLAVAQDELRAKLPPRAVSWTRPEKIHLTLRFLGDVDPAQIESLTWALQSATANFGPLPLVAERLGCFPNLHHSRVCWAWVHDADERERLAELHRRIVDATARFTNEPAEGRFVGHITLARFRQINRPQVEHGAEFDPDSVDRCFGEWTASSVVLMRSDSFAVGSLYTCLAELSLEHVNN